LETERKRDYNRYFREPFYNKRYGKEWRRIRDRYIKAHPLCEECMKHGRFTAATEVHHILPLSEGGGNERENLMSLCHECHSSITMAANNRKT
jgi:5-methylcytosine-specific restriction protein A